MSPSGAVSAGRRRLLNLLLSPASAESFSGIAPAVHSAAALSLLQSAQNSSKGSQGGNNYPHKSLPESMKDS
eukprot:SAG31_NODE_17574_length_666_cov_0.883598_1_plen_71_part_10